MDQGPPQVIEERLYTQQEGQLRKWKAVDLTEVTNNDWPVDIQHPVNSKNLIPYAWTLSSDNETLIGAASRPLGTDSVLFAVDKIGGNSSKQTFDVHKWFMDHKCVDSCQAGNDAPCNTEETNCCAGEDCFAYPTDRVLISNSASIARDPDNSNYELVFVLTAGDSRLSVPGYLLAVIFDKTTKTFGAGFGSMDPVKWLGPPPPTGYTPPDSGTSPVVSIHPSDSAKDRVYFVSGDDKDEDPPDLPVSLFSIRTSDGELLGKTDFNIGKARASVVVDYRSDAQISDGNMIYVHVFGGPTRGFLDDFSGTPGNPATLDCKWKTDFYIMASLGNAAKSDGGLLYGPFTKDSAYNQNDTIDQNLYAGAFDPDDIYNGLYNNPNDPSEKCDVLGKPVWEIAMEEGAIDRCTRAIGEGNFDKPQVYFGTRRTFYSYEEQ